MPTRQVASCPSCKLAALELHSVSLPQRENENLTMSGSGARKLPAPPAATPSSHLQCTDVYYEFQGEQYCAPEKVPAFLDKSKREFLLLNSRGRETLDSYRDHCVYSLSAQGVPLPECLYYDGHGHRRLTRPSAPLTCKVPWPRSEQDLQDELANFKLQCEIYNKIEAQLNVIAEAECSTNTRVNTSTNAGADAGTNAGTPQAASSKSTSSTSSISRLQSDSSRQGNSGRIAEQQRQEQAGQAEQPQQEQAEQQQQQRQQQQAEQQRQDCRATATGAGRTGRATAAGAAAAGAPAAAPPATPAAPAASTAPAAAAATLAPPAERDKDAREEVLNVPKTIPRVRARVWPHEQTVEAPLRQEEVLNAPTAFSQSGNALAAEVEATALRGAELMPSVVDTKATVLRSRARSRDKGLESDVAHAERPRGTLLALPQQGTGPQGHLTAVPGVDSTATAENALHTENSCTVADALKLDATPNPVVPLPRVAEAVASVGDSKVTVPSSKGIGRLRGRNSWSDAARAERSRGTLLALPRLGTCPQGYLSAATTVPEAASIAKAECTPYTENSLADSADDDSLSSDAEWAPGNAAPPASLRLANAFGLLGESDDSDLGAYAASESDASDSPSSGCLPVFSVDYASEEAGDADGRFEQDWWPETANCFDPVCSHGKQHGAAEHSLTHDIIKGGGSAENAYDMPGPEPEITSALKEKFEDACSLDPRAPPFFPIGGQQLQAAVAAAKAAEEAGTPASPCAIPVLDLQRIATDQKLIIEMLTDVRTALGINDFGCSHGLPHSYHGGLVSGSASSSAAAVRSPGLVAAVRPLSQQVYVDTPSPTESVAFGHSVAANQTILEYQQ